MAAPKRISLARRTHELPIIDAIDDERRNFHSARSRRILELRKRSTRTAETALRRRHKASSRPILAKKGASSVFWPLMRLTTKV